MFPQNRQRRVHQCAQHLLAFPFRQEFPDGLSHNILRGHQLHTVFAFRPHHDVAVGHAGIKLHHLRPQLLVDVVNQLLRFECINLAGGEVLHRGVRTQFRDVIAATIRPQRHEIAAIRDVVWVQHNVEPGSLERSRPRRILLRIIAEE